MATLVTVQRTGLLVKAFIDGKELAFGADNQSQASVEAGTSSLTWVVVGAPGDSYTIAITSPAAIAFSHQGTLDSSKKDAGIQWFTV